MPKYAIVNKTTGEIDDNCVDCLLLSVSTEQEADHHFEHALQDKLNHIAVKVESDDDWEKLKEVDYAVADFEVPAKTKTVTEIINDIEVEKTVPIPAHSVQTEMQTRKHKIDLNTLQVAGKGQ